MKIRIFIGLCFIFTGILFFLIFFPVPAHKKVVIDIKPGQYFDQTLKKLKEKNLIRSVLLTKIVSKLLGFDKKIQTGEYLIDKELNLIALLKLLSSGKHIIYTITFPEGINLYEIAKKLDETGLILKKEFLDLAFNQDYTKALLGEKLYSFEGYLFPETYKITKYTGAKNLIKLMVDQFLQVYKEIRPRETALARQFKKGEPMTRKEIVILASIIEKETGIPSERRLISSVFHNRLSKNMRLETDPTIIYGILDRTKKTPKNIRKKDIRTKDDYNTYILKGFPKGPIGNPGQESLLASINPQKSNYFFFVSRNDGSHFFSSTYEEHLKAVRQYQLSRPAVRRKTWAKPKNSN